MTMKHLCVEGWRFIPHSYALVNQWQLLSIVKRKDIRLSVRDIPYYREHWRPTKGLFTSEQEQTLASIPACGFKDNIDAIFRISFPYEFSATSESRTVVFGTSESQCLEENDFTNVPDIKSLAASKLFSVVTPSHWSREGFLRLGLRNEQVIVISHGVDATVFYQPTEQERYALRKKLGISGFVFANVSAMTENKGIDLLLRAFAAVAEKRPNARLLLKGADRLYSSQSFVRQAIANLPSRLKQRIVDRFSYFGDTISNGQMAQFYQAADAFVSPYRAEGFNLPVLEASACGTPVICTKGGSTDDFMKENFTHFIHSKLRTNLDIKNRGVELEPDLDHLIHLMFRIMDDEEWNKRAGVAGANHAAMHFNWDLVVNKLLSTIFVPSL
jgi:glycosyltransferase involved in cell wall biosynthesis